MSKKVDENFKEEFDGELQKGVYATKNIGVRAFIAGAVLTACVGLCGVGYTLTIGKWQKNAEREVFKESTAYTEQAASFLAKEYKEYNDAENDADKKTIMEYVVMRYPNLDTDSIDNETLRQFYTKCLNN